MQESGVVTSYNGETFLEWILENYKDLPSLWPERLWSASFDGYRRFWRHNSESPSVNISVVLRSVYGGDHPRKIVIGIVENTTGKNSENLTSLIFCGIAQWTSIFQGFTAPCMFPVTEVHPWRWTDERFPCNLQMFCELLCTDRNGKIIFFSHNDSFFFE